MSDEAAMLAVEIDHHYLHEYGMDLQEFMLKTYTGEIPPPLTLAQRLRWFLYDLGIASEGPLESQKVGGSAPSA